MIDPSPAPDPFLFTVRTKRPASANARGAKRPWVTVARCRSLSEAGDRADEYSNAHDVDTAVFARDGKIVAKFVWVKR